LKLNSFIFYLRIFEKQCNAPFVDLLWLNYLNITLLGERGVTEDLKLTENRRLGQEERQNAPRAWEKCLGRDLTYHAPMTFLMCLGYAKGCTLMRPMDFLCAPCMQKVGAQLSFPASVLGKARTFSPNLDRNYLYKYQPSSFKISRSEMWQFKRKETLELRESFYLLVDFLGYVFIFSNLFLVTMCN